MKSAKLSRATDTGGFTLVELLVVIAVIAILVALQIPVLAWAKTNAQGNACLSNMKQLQMAALLYAYNNNDYMPANVPLSPGYGGDSTTGIPNWVDGTFSNAGFLTDNPVGCATNPFYLGVQGKTGGNPTVTLIGSIGPYARAAGVYHCPADNYLDPTWHALRARSCSMNLQVGTGSRGFGADNVNYVEFIKTSDFGGGLAASDCFVFLDENPQSLNDGWFEYLLDGSKINDRPAVNHGRYSSFSFADGHAEPHEWHDAFLSYNTPNTMSGADTIWLAQHGTYHR